MREGGREKERTCLDGMRSRKRPPVNFRTLKFSPNRTDRSPLASMEQFYKYVALNPGLGRAKRMSLNFLDSAWYYLRYPSVKDKAMLDKATTKKWFR